MATPKLWSLLAELKSPSYKWVDLTHAFDDDSPHWQGFPAMTTKLVYDYKNGDIFQTQQFTVVGQYGTHVDAPIHFYPEGRTLDEIEVTEFTYPLCVIDVHNQVAANPDYALSIADIKTYEESYGQIPDGAFVAMRSDWCKRWPDEKGCMEFDEKGNVHYPGWSLEAIKFLVEERNVGAIGHEAFDTAPPALEEDKPMESETYILSQNRIQIEVMANLDKVPPAGAIIFCTFPKAKNASGFPARCFALCEA